MSEERLTSKEVNILCAGLIQLKQRSPRRGQDVLAVRCPDLKTRHIRLDDIADLVDRLNVLAGGKRGELDYFARELAKESKNAGMWPE